MRKEYKTVLNEACAEIEEKKSRFIASVRQADSEEQALEFLNGLKSKYWDASHNVYAYHIGGESIVQRFSDDGEPSGTAGLPVLEVIRKTDVQDVIVVVTRYFGGTLLGAAGLVRAYSRCAALGIEAAGIVKKQLCIEALVILEYTLLGKIQSIIISKGYNIKTIVYQQDVEIFVYVPVDEREAFMKIITEASNARAIVDWGCKVFVTLDAGGRIIL